MGIVKGIKEFTLTGITIGVVPGSGPLGIPAVKGKMVTTSPGQGIASMTIDFVINDAEHSDLIREVERHAPNLRSSRLFVISPAGAGIIREEAGTSPGNMVTTTDWHSEPSEVLRRVNRELVPWLIEWMNRYLDSLS